MDNQNNGSELVYVGKAIISAGEIADAKQND